MFWYYKFLIRRPYAVVLGIIVLSLACIIVSLIAKEWPDFSEPTLGFEARGTVIGKRLTAWKNLLKETRPSGKVVDDPNELQLEDDNNLRALNNLQASVSSQKKHHKKYDNKRKKLKKDKNNENLNNKIKVLKNLLNNDNSNDSILLPKNLLSSNNSYTIDADSVFIRDYDETNDTKPRDRNHYDYGRNVSFTDEDDSQEILKQNTWKELKTFNPSISSDYHESDDIQFMTDRFFCQSPVKEFSHFVIERIEGYNESIFEINSLLAMCQLEQKIVETSGYSDNCQKELNSSKCCRPWSLPNYIALLGNKTSCFDIDENDVILSRNLLLNCFDYFHSLKLNYDCQKYKCRAPYECTRHDAVYNILNFLTDINFIQLNQSHMFLRYSMIFVPIAKSSEILYFFHNLAESDLKNELVAVVAMDLGLENALFDESLLTDGWLFALGAVFIMICIWLYTGSFFATIMTVLAVFFSLGIAYFVYILVFEMVFFPFMNLLAVVVLIGIGADDAFIFVKIWQFTLAERIKNVDVPNSNNDNHHDTESLNYLMAVTLRHSAVSMFVTSLTTASAFYASLLSSITAVKCFGIFAGTAILSNYLLMVTWLPATISIMERIPYRFGHFISMKLSQKLNKSIKEKSLLIENYIIYAINKLSLFWIILFSLIGICSYVIVFYWPCLQLPESRDFRLFVKNHPFELYDTKYKEQFWFERSFQSIDNFKLPLRFVWGVLPIDNGDYTDPNSKGDLFFDNNFNISTYESQLWLLNFCKRLKLQSFYHITFGLLLSNCFIENFITWMNRRCIDEMDNFDRTPCCEISKFPFESHIFDLCLPKCISALHATPRQYIDIGVSGPKFARRPSKTDSITNIQGIEDNITKILPPIVKAVVVEYDSNYSFSYSTSYTDMKQFFTLIESWFQKELKTAPVELQGGWFISDLDFFDLQDSLRNGTISAIIIAMNTSLIILFLVTLNMLVSIYAAITVFLTILTTISILILLGWKLNILESVSISTAIGLAVDFSLHYSIQYSLSSNLDRSSAFTYSISRILAPTAMAALTTGAAGAFMLLSNLLPYIQIGLFLVIVMIVSWMYATFFLMSLLKLFGPQYGFLQFSYPTLKRNKNSKKNIKEIEDRRITTVSERLLTPSSSAIGDLLNSESHELDSLTSNSVPRQTNILEYPPLRPNIDRDSDTIINGNRQNKEFYKDYRSPSTGSAITVVLSDQIEITEQNIK